MIIKITKIIEMKIFNDEFQESLIKLNLNAQHQPFLIMKHTFQLKYQNIGFRYHLESFILKLNDYKIYPSFVGQLCLNHHESILQFTILIIPSFKKLINHFLFINPKHSKLV